MKKILLFAIGILSLTIKGNSQNVPAYVPTNGLVGYWGFNGNANDQSGNGNNGIDSGAVLTTDRYGNANSAFNFNGSNYIDCGESAQFAMSNGLTLSCWGKTTNQSSNLCIAGRWSNVINPAPFGSPEYCLFFNSTDVFSAIVVTSPPNEYTATPFNYYDGNWHMYTMTYDGVNNKVYVDGVLRNTLAVSGNIKSFLNKFVIGTYSLVGYPNLPNSWVGSIDDVGLWNRALSSQEIASLYKSCTPQVATTSSLPAYISDNANIISLVGYPSGGTFSGNGITNNTLNPSTAGFGTLDIKYNFIDQVGGCKDSTIFKTVIYDTVGVVKVPTPVFLPSYLPSNGLLAWYPFNGNANDLSGNGNNGTVNGATLTTDRFGNGNSAYSFNGVNNDILIQMDSTLAPRGKQNYCYSLWIQANPGNGEIMQFFTGTSGTNISNYELAINGGKLGFNHYPFINNINSPDSTPSNIWTNILVNIDQVNDTVKFYKNGTFWYKGAVSTLSPGAGLLSFGAIAFNKAGPYKGNIDDIAIYGRALSQQEISNLYNASICQQSVTVTDTLVINTTMTGFNPITYANTIKVYPNPAHDQLTINNGNISNLTNYQIKISNALAQQVFQTTISQPIYTVNISNWVKGIYYVNVTNAQGVTIDTKTLVIQ